jgi:hypothetical protein
LTTKERDIVEKLLSAKDSKTGKEQVYEEYLRQLELAIENH